MIPGVKTYHPRSVWEPAGFRMASDFDRKPPAYVAANVRMGAIHYSAALNLPDGDLNEFDNQIGPWLAAVTRDYLTNRNAPPGYKRLSDGRVFPGYPIGYSFAVDWLGGVWELRGFDFRPAATNAHNGYTIAILMLSDRADPSSDLAWEAVRAILREAKRRSGRTDFANRPLGHGEFHATTGTGTPTACPGVPNLNQVHAGLADLDYTPPKPPPPPPPEEPTVRYFTLVSAPGTLWATSDGLIAVRLEGHQVAARADLPATIPVLPDAEAAKLVFLAGLPSLSVK